MKKLNKIEILAKNNELMSAIAKEMIVLMNGSLSDEVINSLTVKPANYAGAKSLVLFTWWNSKVGYLNLDCAKEVFTLKAFKLEIAGRPFTFLGEGKFLVQAVNNLIVEEDVKEERAAFALAIPAAPVSTKSNKI